MTTMLEKAAKAICVEDGCNPEWFPADDDTETPLWTKYVPAARAALQAIREVDQETYNAGRAAMTGEPDAGPGEPWLAMIDAILEEKTP